MPKSAAVNEGVNLAKRYGHKASSNFVNAILRKVEKKDYKDFFTIENNIERISKTTSMPEWIVEELLKNNILEKVEEICKSSNIKPKLQIRVNQLKIDQETLKQELEKEKIKVIRRAIRKFFATRGCEKYRENEIFPRWKNYYTR